MKRSLSRILWAASTLLLIGLFAVAVAPARADGVGDRITALEEELAQLKGEQAQMREEALAAKAKLPSFRYRPRGGLRLRAPDKSWSIRFRGRAHHRVLFFLDDEATSDGDGGEFSQFEVALRRLRPEFVYCYDNCLYQLVLELDGTPSRNFRIQHGEVWFNMNKRVHPVLPNIGIGPRTSNFLNKHDTNWSSRTGAIFDRSMFQDGAGIGAGTSQNGISFDWRKIPLPGLPGVIDRFHANVSNQGLQSIANQPEARQDQRTGIVSIHIIPFKKSKSKMLKGIDFSFGGVFENLLDPDRSSVSNQNFFRVRSSERRRLRFIELSTSGGREPSGFRYYLTPGFGWKYGPYWLRTAGGFNRGHFGNTDGGKNHGFIQGNMFRITHELFIWSPKGWFTGSVNRPRSLQFFTSFERDDYKAPTGAKGGTTGGLRDCSRATEGGNCKGQSVHLTAVGFWWHFRPGVSTGMQYSHYNVNKAGRLSDIRNAKKKRGQRFSWNTIQWGVRFDW